MWTAFEIIVNIFQGCLMIWFMKHSLQVNTGRNLLDVAGVSAVTMFLSVYENIFSSIPDTIVFVLPFLYGWIISKKQWYISAFWAIILGIGFTTCTSLTLRIFTSWSAISFESLMANSLIRLAFVLSTNALLFLFFWRISCIKIWHHATQWKTFLLFLIMNAGMLFVEETVYMVQEAVLNQVDAWPFLIAYVVILSCVFLLMLLFSQLSHSAEQENQYRVEVNAFRMSQQYNREIQAAYEELQIQRHDFKHHLQVIEEMLASQEKPSAAEYMSEYKKRIESIEITLTGNGSVDAVINAKRHTMERNGLRFKMNTYPLQELPVEPVDFCTVLGNLLDNAIEGTMRLPEPGTAESIKLTISRSWDMLYLFCVNDCDPATIKRNSSGWISSKSTNSKDEQHAFGIRSIERIVQQAGGHTMFTVKGRTFNAKIVIPFKHTLSSLNP